MTTRALVIDPADAVPIWRQIEQGITRLVASGALAPGGSVPSVRDLAKDLRVNPNTVAKAYQRLVDTGVLMVKRGEGTYVAEAPPPLKRSEQRRQLREAAGRYAVVASTLRARRQEAVEEVRSALDRFLKKEKGDRR